ncbi:MAG: hypothetical protein U0798_17070 [Gemmataceae bacterium]
MIRCLRILTLCLGVGFVLPSGCAKQKKSARVDSASANENASGSSASGDGRKGRSSERDSAIDLYGEPVDETPVSAKDAPPGSVMQPRKGDSVFRLSNARFLPIGEKPFPQIKVDYEWVREGEFNGQSLVIHRADGQTRTVMLMYPLRDRRGTISIDLGIAPPGQTQPKDAELYLTRNDPRWGFQSPTFKVSNSVFMGSFDSTKNTPVRRWTAEEAERLRKPPPAYSAPNTKDGRDTPFAGDTTGGGSFRYADPVQPMIGVEYTTGSWDGTNCIGSITPVYTVDQPTMGGTRIMAKKGQIVCGFEVQTKVFVTAIRLITREENGTGDKTDKTEWFGFPNAEAEKNATTLGGKGETVIGVHMKRGAILNGIALVIKE